MLAKIVLGGLTGIAFGYALQRGRFCVNTAFRDVLFIKDSTLLRALVLAISVQLLGVTVLRSLHFFNQIQIPPFFWQANLVGGYVFGLGMVLAGGCASGSCYRTGEGMLGSLIALIAFGITSLTTDSGALAPIERALRAQVLTAHGQPVTIDTLLGVNVWWVVAPIVVLAAWWVWRGRTVSHHSAGWSWRTAGFAIGLIGVAGWITSAATGREFGFSVTGPLRALFGYLATGNTAYLDWGAWMLLGLILGANLSAALHAERKLRLPKPNRLVQSLIGGVLMGFGAQIAGGCNIGHTFTGMATLSIASLATTTAIFAGGWTMILFMFIRPAWLERSLEAFKLGAARKVEA
ncbi:MAG TPA: YeeE/YedE family protein [Limnochordia bacterium]|nr:YeeE/YedE family protein [Limnochordia bacterium]